MDVVIVNIAHAVNDRLFRVNTEYPLVATEMKPDGCGCTGYTGNVPHYVVIIDGRSYSLSSQYCSVVNKPLPEDRSVHQELLNRTMQIGIVEGKKDYSTIRIQNDPQKIRELADEQARDK